MKRKLFSEFACIVAFTIILSGCAGRQNGSNTETSLPSNSGTTQGTDSSSSADISSDTEKKNSTASNASSPNQTNGSLSGTNSQTKPPVESTSPESQPSDNSTTEENTVEKMNLQIGNNSFTATLESNAAVDALVDMMREAPVVIQMSNYSGFEKVGSLGTSLPTSNKQTTTQSGDIVLYNGNQIVIFYGSNSWSYTRLGRIDDLSGWKDALGSGDVTVTFSLR